MHVKRSIGEFVSVAPHCTSQVRHLRSSTWNPCRICQPRLPLAVSVQPTKKIMHPSALLHSLAHSPPYPHTVYSGGANKALTHALVIINARHGVSQGIFFSGQHKLHSPPHYLPIAHLVPSSPHRHASMPEFRHLALKIFHSDRYPSRAVSTRVDPNWPSPPVESDEMRLR